MILNFVFQILMFLLYKFAHILYLKIDFTLPLLHLLTKERTTMEEYFGFYFFFTY
jgi:hypothetical protein